MIKAVFLYTGLFFGTVALLSLGYGLLMNWAEQHSLTVKDKPVQTGTMDVKR